MKLYGVIEDIEDSKSVQAALEAQQDRQQAIFEGFGFTAYDWDGEYQRIYFQDMGRLCKTGTTNEQRDDTSSGYVNLVHPEDYDEYSARFRDYIKGSR